MFGWMKKPEAAKPTGGLVIPDQLPHRFEVIPGQLEVELHRLEERDWVFISNGMQAHGQREMVLCLRIPNATSLPTDPFPFFSQCLQMAQQGMTVDHNGRTGLGPNQMFGRQDVTGLIYVDCPDLGIPLPPEALLVVPLVAEELQIREQAGHLRILSQLGRQVRYYPFPYWFDLKRKPVPLASRIVAETIFNKLGRLSLWSVRAWIEGETIKVRIDSSALPQIQNALKTLPAEAPLAILTGLDDDADGCLVWCPGEAGPQAITPDGSQGRRLAGAFLLVCPVEEGSEDFRMMEDGFGFLLSPARYATFLERLQAGLNLELRGLQVGLSLEWTTPRKTGALDFAGLQIGTVTLYQPDHVLRQRLVDGVKALAGYHQSLCAGLIDYFRERSLPAHGFFLAVGIKPDGSTRIWIDDLDSGYQHFGELARQLEKVAPPRVEGGPFAFGFDMQVQACLMEHMPQIPRAWAPSEGADWTVPDGVFAHIWPD